MTTPQGPSGLNSDATWVVSGNDGSVSGLPARTQDNVTATLKTQMRQSNAWKNSSAAVWEGLRPGVPLTLSTIEAIAKRLLGLDDKTWDTVTEALEAIDLSWLWAMIQNLLNWVFDPLAGAPNLLLDPEFRWDGNLGSDWFYDTEVSHAASPYEGSRRTTADGLVHALRSNIVPVNGIDEFEARIGFLADSAVTLTSGCFTLQLVTFKNKVQVGIVDIDAFALSYLTGGAPRFGDPGAWDGAPSGAIAGDLAGRWTVPTDGSVDAVCQRAAVMASGGGWVWVDHGRLAQHGGLLALLVAVYDALVAFVSAIWTALMRWAFGVQDGSPYEPGPDEDFEFPDPVPADRYARIDPAHYGDPFSVPLWDSMAQHMDAAWHVLVGEIIDLFAIENDDVPDLGQLIRHFLTENPVFGWLFKIGFAVTDWVGSLWTAVMRFIFGVAYGSPYYDPSFTGSADDKKPFSAALWDEIITVCTDGYNLMVIAILEAQGYTPPDDDVDRSLAVIIRYMLTENPTVGWLFKIGFAVVDWIKECWDAAADWFLGDAAFPGSSADKLPFSRALWDSLVSRWRDAWDDLVDAINDAIDGEVREINNIVDMITDALLRNPVFGWLFDMMNDWLQPILTIGKAVADWGAAVWTAISTFAGSPTGGAWNTMVTAITTAWNTMVDAIFAAWGSDKTHADVVNPAVATEAALKNNPVTGWLFAGSGGTSWLTLFDPARKFINQMVQGLHRGYFDASWVWVVSWTTPSTALPGSGAMMTPGRTDGDGTGLATTVDSTIPAAPTGLIAVPWPDLTVPNFPAGGITYAIAAVKSGVEGPATQVSVFATTLIPPNCYGHVDLAWNAVTGATGYRIYRKVDATYQATDWRLIGSPTSASSVLLPWQDKIVRTAGTVAHPKTDAELSAQIVTDVQTTALGAEATAGAAQATATAAGTNIQATMDAVSIGATGDPTLSSVSMPTVQGSVDGLRQTGADNAESLSDILAKINGVPASPGLTPSPSTTTASSSSSAWGSGWTFYSSPSGVTGRALAGNGWYIGTESGSLSQGMGIVTTQLLNSDGSLPTRWTAVAGVDGIPSSVFGETNNSALVFGGAVSNTLGSYRLYARLYGSKIEVGYCTGFTRTVLSTYTYATGSSAMLTLGLKPGTISGKWTVYATTSNGRCYTQATNVTLPFTPGGYFGSGLTAGTSGTPPRIRSLQAVTIEADTVPGIVGRFTASGGVLTTSQVTIFPWNVSGSPYFVSTDGPGASGAGHGVLFNYPGMYNIQVNVPFTNGPDNDTTVALRSYLNSNIVTDYQEQQGSYSISSKAKRFQWNYQLPVAAGMVFACGIATNKELSTPQAVIYISRAGIFS